MRFLPRLVVSTALGIAAFLSWRLLLRTPADGQGGDLDPKVVEGFTLALDTFLHIQQLRKKRLRAFCSQSHKVTTLPRSQEERAYLLSSLRVSTRLDLLYCQVPSMGMEEWQQLLEKLEKENITLPVLLPYHRRHTKETQLSKFNQTEIEAMLGSYTKVLFVRDPFHRLIATFLQGMGSSPSFGSFVQDVLDSETHSTSVDWKPLVSLCHPCLVQYDYVVMFGFHRQELGHLLRRAGLPVDSLLPKFTDTQVLWTYRWLTEQMFSELSVQQKKQLSRFYRLGCRCDWMEAQALQLAHLLHLAEATTRPLPALVTELI